MNIIFLDVDGVLNTPRYIEYQIKYDRLDGYDAQFNFDPICMKNLKELVEKTNAKIVISSTWRLLRKEKDIYWIELMNNLRLYGLEDKVIDCTPSLDIDTNRGQEIKKWIEENNDKDIENFVIIDDDTDMDDIFDKLAKCDIKRGFTREVKEVAFKILSNI